MRVGIHIETTYSSYPPHPSMRWRAVERDNWEPGCPDGRGATEAEAIADLLFEIEERPSCNDWYVVLSVSEAVSYF